MKRFYLTVDAENDLEEIADYIASDSPAAAGRLLERIEDRCQALAEMPEVGVLRDEVALGLRSAAVGKYVIFYDEDDEGIRIFRVLHGSREIERILS